MSYDAPFAGLKVVDLSQGIAGPYCAMLLAQHGADVIKVEGIGDGDWARTLGTRHGSHSSYSVIGNRGKRSIAVDLKSAAGKDVVWRLLKGADVFLEGFRPGVIKRLGFDYDSVAAHEPRLLYPFRALSAALYARRDEARGRYIEVRLMQAATALQSIRLMASHLDGGT